MSDVKSIGVFGGTFDPIHFGHLRAALEIRDLMQLEQIRLIPCKHPPHRKIPIVSAEHRLRMVMLATEGTELMIDDREMHREGPSYSIDTLMSLRREFPYASLSMIVGVDAFLSLPSWYQWKKLIQLANIIVMYRSGWGFPENGIIHDLQTQNALKPGESITDFANGKILLQSITMLDIQSSQIRKILAEHKTAKYLVPDKVCEYIKNHQLYGYNADGSFVNQEVANI